jgi:Tfp pilus assembly protein PilN
MKINNRKSVDFAQLYKNNEHERKSLSPIVVVGSLVLTVVIIFAVYNTVTLYQRNEEIKNQITEVESYIYDSKNIELVNEVNKKDEEILSLKLVSDDFDSMNTIINLYPEFGTNFVDLIEYEGITITDISYYVSGLQISANSTDMNTLTNYIRYLKETNLFYSVSYNGFAKDDEGIYSFNVETVVARGENYE